MTVDDYLRGREESAGILRRLSELVGKLGPYEAKATKSQVAFIHRRAFAHAWIPGKYVKSGVPLVLSVPLTHRDSSPRTKEISHPTRRWYMHHLEVRLRRQLDAEVEHWLRLSRRLAEGGDDKKPRVPEPG